MGFVDDDPQRPCGRAYARLCNQTSPAGVWWSVGDEGLARAEHQRVFFQSAGWMIGVGGIERLYLRADCMCTKARDGQRKASGCVVVCPWYTMRSNVVMISRLPELPPPLPRPLATVRPRATCVLHKTEPACSGGKSDGNATKERGERERESTAEDTAVVFFIEIGRRVITRPELVAPESFC